MVYVEESVQSTTDGLARELRLLKDRAGLSLARLAARCWCSRSSLERYLNGKVFPPRDTVQAISDTCGGDTAAVLTLWELAWAARGGKQRGRAAAGRPQPAARERAATPLTPAQLPPDVGGFTGRSTQLARLDSVVAELADGAGAGSVPVAAVAGTAGVGKTALAVHFGHRVAGRFPDGQLFLDMRGYAATPPMTAVEALGWLLRSLGVPADQIPPDEQEQAALYRSALAGKRVLVVLDNARSAAQICPLVPASPHSLVVVTSRTTLANLDGARHVQLDILSEREALALLTRLVGADRVTAEPVATGNLVGLCARLPLAVRIAAARLAARPTWTIATLVDRLADQSRRLDELRVGERAVRASFAVTYHALKTSDDPVDHRAARMFRLLGMLDWVQMSVPVAAALLDQPHPDAAAALERLLDVRLLASAKPGRYHTHDLLRLYARDQARHEETKATHRAALHRALDCYLAAAEQASLLINARSRSESHLGAQAILSPHGRFTLSRLADIPAWADAEHANLIAAAKQAAATPDTADRAVRLTAALHGPFRTRAYWRDLITLRELAARVAHDLGDRRGEALAHEHIAWANAIQGGSAEEVLAPARRALALWRELGDRRGESACHIWLGHAYREQARLDDALTSHRQALIISRGIGDHDREAAALNALGLAYQRLECLDKAIAHHHQSLTVYRVLGNRTGIASTLGNIGWAYHRAGQHEAAVTYQQRALTLADETGHRYQQAEFRWALGQAHHALGNHDQARTNWQLSITILHDIGTLTADQADALRRQPIPRTPRSSNATPDRCLHATRLIHSPRSLRIRAKAITRNEYARAASPNGTRKLAYALVRRGRRRQPSRPSSPTDAFSHPRYLDYQYVTLQYLVSGPHIWSHTFTRTSSAVPSTTCRHV